MASQSRTFQIRLPRGAHEAALDEMGALFGGAERRLNANLRRMHADNAARGLDRKAIDKAIATLKSETMKSETMKAEGITARQYNGLLRCLEGKHESIRDLAKARIEQHKDRIADLEKKTSKRGTRLDAQARNDAKIAERAARGKGPTKAQASKHIPIAQRRKERFAQHQQKRRQESLRLKLDRDREIAAAAVPPIVFGSKKRLRDREKFHPDDARGVDAWRADRDNARSAQIMFVGSSDDTCGNQTCQGLVSDTDTDAGKPASLSLWIKVAPRLVREVGLPDRMAIDEMTLPAFGAQEIARALRDNASGTRKASIACRFVRDPGWSDARRLSAWRVCITVECEIPEADFVRAPGAGDRAAGRGVLGVDVNVDHLAVAHIDATGNPVGTWRIDLPSRGKTSDQREAIIGDASAQVCALARSLGTPLALEALDFSQKKKELGRLAKTAKADARKRRARMLSSFAYGAISTMIGRRAEREGIAVRRVNPACTSLIGETNYARRYGLSIHRAAAVAIARRAAGYSERLDYVHGARGLRSTRPTRSESRRHVWRRWAGLYRDRSRTASVRTPSRTSSKAASGNRRSRAGRSSDDPQPARA